MQFTGFHVFRYLVERIVPGNRVSIMGIYSIKKVRITRKSQKGMAVHLYFTRKNCHYFKGAHEKTSVGIRRPYLRVVGIQVETERHSRVSVGESLSPE